MTDRLSKDQLVPGIGQGYFDQILYTVRMKTTKYFDSLKSRPDRGMILESWIQEVVDHPVKQLIQADGRIRLWGQIREMEGRYLRVILLEDGETVHNAFFDRGFKP